MRWERETSVGSEKCNYCQQYLALSLSVSPLSLVWNDISLAPAVHITLVESRSSIVVVVAVMWCHHHHHINSLFLPGPRINILRPCRARHTTHTLSADPGERGWAPPQQLRFSDIRLLIYYRCVSNLFWSSFNCD